MSTRVEVESLGSLADERRLPNSGRSPEINGAPRGKEHLEGARDIGWSHENSLGRVRRNVACERTALGVRHEQGVAGIAADGEGGLESEWMAPVPKEQIDAGVVR